MQDLLDQFYEYLWGIWRYRWAGLVCAWALAIIGWVWVSQVPEQYLAKARIHIDSSSILRPLLRGLAIEPNVNQRIALMSRTLFSRPNIEKLMRMADLDLQVTNDLEKEKLLEKISDGLKLSGEARNSSLYSISFTHEDRDIAKKVVQSVITILVENTLGDTRKDNAGASEFLSAQIDDYEGRMLEAETRLAEFKQQNVGLLSGETSNYYRSLEVARSELGSAQLELKEMENRRREVQRQLDGEEPVFGFGGEDLPSASGFDQRISSLEGKLDNLLMKYTERHPEVVQIRALIDELDGERQQDIADVMSEPGAYTSLNQNPVYQQMRTMLSESEARVAELKIRVGEYARRLKLLEDKVDSIPVVESELKQLNRDYAVISQQHTALLKRRESAHISGEVSQKANDVKFKVIDPPFVPLEPTEPDKLILHSGVFIVAIGAGGGMALFLSLLRPVICNRRSLENLTGFPVLGSVSMIASVGEKAKALHEKLLFASMVLFLFLTFAGVNLGQSLLST